MTANRRTGRHPSSVELDRVLRTFMGDKTMTAKTRQPKAPSCRDCSDPNIGVRVAMRFAGFQGDSKGKLARLYECPICGRRVTR